MYLWRLTTPFAAPRRPSHFCLVAGGEGGIPGLLRTNLAPELRHFLEPPPPPPPPLFSHRGANRSEIRICTHRVIKSGRCAFNPGSQGFYLYKSVFLSRSFALMSLITIALGWSFPNKVTRTTLSRACIPCDMAMVGGKETPSGVVSVAASSSEGAVPPSAMT